MATQIQHRRGTTAQHSTFTGVVGEVTVDTDKKSLVVHDGTTPGGIPIAKSSDLGVPQTSLTGSAVLPKGTTAQRDVTPATGYTRFNEDYAKTEVYNGTAWAGLGGATGAGGDDIFYENGQTITTDYTITSGKNAMTAGPITINTGVSVTIPTGSTWSIV